MEAAGLWKLVVCAGGYITGAVGTRRVLTYHNELERTLGRRSDRDFLLTQRAIPSIAMAWPGVLALCGPIIVLDDMISCYHEAKRKMRNYIKI